MGEEAGTGWATPPGNAPILEHDEHDPTQEAVIEPSRILRPVEDMPRRAVACFFQDVLTELAQRHEMRVLKRLRSELGTHPVYELEHGGERIAVFHPGVGAPLAAAILEEVIALGCRDIIACGGCGVLDSTIAVGHVIVPTSAVRDEGTSYHYLPPTRTVEPHPEALAAVEATLRAADVPYLTGTTWTTDAIYRETREQVRRRRAEGCIAVEMEAATFFAVARFRGVRFGQLLYGGDDVAAEEWSHRHWQAHGVRETLFTLAADAVLRLA